MLIIIGSFPSRETPLAYTCEEEDKKIYMLQSDFLYTSYLDTDFTDGIKLQSGLLVRESYYFSAKQCGPFLGIYNKRYC